MTEKPLTGRCLCGAVRYETDAPVSNPAFCHCESCRRAAGAHIVAWMTVRSDGMKFTQGKPKEFASSPPVLRTFCGQCGTPLTYRHSDSPDTVDVTISTLDDAGAIAPTDHIWMEDAVAWDLPADNRPQHQKIRGKNLNPSGS